MKILITNLDVGSGIEYVGNKIVDWVKKSGDVIVFKDQTCVSYFTDELIKHNPDIIIVNEYFPRIIEPIYYYKRYHPNVKVLFVSHSWKTLLDLPENETNYLTRRMTHLFTKDTCDKIICLSRKYTTEGKYLFKIENKLTELYMPVSSEEYRVITPWSERKKLFGHFGNPVQARLSQEFVNKIRQTDLKIDCYGDRGMDRIEDHPNFIPYPRIKQEDFPRVLNEYKFFVLPHNGEEVFFITLLQAIMCGTIPLVINDRNSNTFEPGWIDWADGLYLQSSQIDPFIKDLITVSTDNETDFETISKNISDKAKKRFDENIIKNEILGFITKC